MIDGLSNGGMREFLADFCIGTKNYEMQTRRVTDQNSTLDRETSQIGLEKGLVVIMNAPRW
jgi:hypothetical protein